jgi:hypothetical protein
MSDNSDAIDIKVSQIQDEIDVVTGGHLKRPLPQPRRRGIRLRFCPPDDRFSRRLRHME